MLDGLVENDIGESTDAVDAPKGMFSLLGVRPICRGHGDGELGVEWLLRAHLPCFMGA